MKMLMILLLTACCNVAWAEDKTTSKDPKPKVTVKSDESAAPGEKVKSDSGDVYNFYFQKAPGANSVEQGKKQKVEPRTSDELSTKKPPITEAEKVKLEPSKFDLQLGLFVTPQRAGKGLLIGVEFNPTSLFGLQLHVMTMAYEVAGNKTSTFSAEGSFDSNQTGSASGGSLAVTLSPVSTGAMKISGVLGAMLVNDTLTEKTHSFGASGSNDSSNTASTGAVLPFGGIEGTYYLSQNFGINGYVNIPTDIRYGQVGIGAVLRL
jgi:hypothetical protein